MSCLETATASPVYDQPTKTNPSRLCTDRVRMRVTDVPSVRHRSCGRFRRGLFGDSERRKRVRRVQCKGLRFRPHVYGLQSRYGKRPTSGKRDDTYVKCLTEILVNATTRFGFGCVRNSEPRLLETTITVFEMAVLRTFALDGSIKYYSNERSPLDHIRRRRFFGLVKRVFRTIRYEIVSQNVFVLFFWLSKIRSVAGISQISAGPAALKGLLNVSTVSL